MLKVVSTRYAKKWQQSDFGFAETIESAISKQVGLGPCKASVRFMFSFPYGSPPLPSWLHFFSTGQRFLE